MLSHILIILGLLLSIKVIQHRFQIGIYCLSIGILLIGIAFKIYLGTYVINCCIHFIFRTILSCTSIFGSQTLNWLSHIQSRDERLI